MEANFSPNAPFTNRMARSPRDRVLAIAASMPPEPDAVRSSTSFSVLR